MYLFFLGYILGIFSSIAWHLQKSGKIKLFWYQWMLIAIIISILVYIFHRYIHFEVGITEDTFAYTIRTFLIPLTIATALIFIIPLWLKRRKKKKEMSSSHTNES